MNIFDGISSSDSSEDEDFKCSTNESSDSHSEDSSTENSTQSSHDEDVKCNANGHSKKLNSSNNLNTSQSKKLKTNGSNGLIVETQSKKKKNECRICCVCLNDHKNKNPDELMECDSCGFFVHEGCYGLSDLESKVSESSNASTEPWFCNSCLLHDLGEGKFNYTKRSVHQCELCPNVDCGLLKETETGKFVHIICALYVPGVAFQNTDKLWPVVLDEIPYQRWGESVCSLCEDARYSRTGVCITCDAGLCKAYFHVTCAQAHGYLVDPEQQHENEPFLAYCKQHLDSSIIKTRRTNYLAMLSNFKSKLSTDGKRNCFKTESNERFLRKLKNARENYILDKKAIQQPNISEHKIQRMISSCPSALKLLLAKNALTNEDTGEVDSHQYKSNFSSKTIRFTSDFVKYFHEREKKMPDYYKTVIELKETQQKLTSQENEQRIIYDNKVQKLDDAKKVYNKNLESLKNISSILNKLSLKKMADSIDSLLIDNKCEAIKAVKVSPMQIDSPTKRKYRKKFKSEQVNNTLLDALCVMCEKKCNSHLLIDCDTCKKFYHINCLSPPLTSVPKKTKVIGWECSDCAHLKDSDNSDMNVSIDIDAPRSLRTKRVKRMTLSQSLSSS